MKHETINTFQVEIRHKLRHVMQKVAKNKGDGANSTQPHHILHLAGELFSAARLWFVLKQNLIKILTASSFLLELSESVVSVSVR